MTTPYPFVAGQVLTAAQLNDIQNLPISDKTTSYVLTATDVYKRTMMNSASATTITVNNSIFTVGDVIQIANKGAGTCTITAGAGVTINTSGSLALAQYGGGYLLCLSASTFTFFNLGGVGYGAATGGTGVTSTTVGGISYAYTSFTSSGTLTVTKAGLFDVLAFGGGSGGGTYSNGSSGGGSGGIVLDTIYLAANISITIGGGGAGNTYASYARYGSATTFGSLPSGRVAAGSYSTCNAGSGASEGLLGGLVGSVLVASTGVTNAQGYAGGNSTASTNGGGGGSTTAVGGNGATTAGGNGAAGYDVSTFIGGSALYKGAGGGGAGSVTQGTGGSGVGTAGSTGTSSSAAANTASGAGGGNTASGNGGSGIIYFRWKV